MTTSARLLVCCLLLVGILPAATVRTLTGEKLTGSGIAIVGETLSVGNHELPLVDVDWIEADRHEAPDPAELGARYLLLADGGVCRLTAIASEADDQVTVTTPRFELTLPLETVLGWGPDETLLARRLEKDRVRLETGSVDGDVLGITDGDLLLQTPLADDPMRLPLDTVGALRLRLPRREVEGLHFAAHLVEGHPPVLLAPTWPPAPALTPEQELPAAGWPRLYVRGGRRVYLSDLELIAVEEEGAFGVVWPHRFGSNLDGSPLVLGGRYYDRCLVVHSKATMRWRLDGDYERFSATVGISDLLGEEGDCSIRLLADDEELWQRESVRGAQDPVDVAVSVAGAQTLTLEVDYGARHDIGDHLVLADPWLLRSGE